MPSNTFGENDNYDVMSSHFFASFNQKRYFFAKKNKKTFHYVMGIWEFQKRNYMYVGYSECLHLLF